MELSVAMTDFRHSNFTEAIYEINVTLDRGEQKWVCQIVTLYSQWYC